MMSQEHDYQHQLGCVHRYLAHRQHRWPQSMRRHLVKVLVKLLDKPALRILLALRSACRLLPPSCTLYLLLVLPTPPRAQHE